MSQATNRLIDWVQTNLIEACTGWPSAPEGLDKQHILKAFGLSRNVCRLDI